MSRNTRLGPVLRGNSRCFLIAFSCLVLALTGSYFSCPEIWSITAGYCLSPTAGGLFTPAGTWGSCLPLRLMRGYWGWNLCLWAGPHCSCCDIPYVLLLNSWWAWGHGIRLKKKIEFNTCLFVCRILIHYLQESTKIPDAKTVQWIFWSTCAAVYGVLPLSTYCMHSSMNKSNCQ